MTKRCFAFVQNHDAASAFCRTAFLINRSYAFSLSGSLCIQGASTDASMLPLMLSGTLEAFVEAFVKPSSLNQIGCRKSEMPPRRSGQRRYQVPLEVLEYRLIWVCFSPDFAGRYSFGLIRFEAKRIRQHISSFSRGSRWCTSRS